jgi:hypothetical protein
VALDNGDPEVLIACSRRCFSRRNFQSAIELAIRHPTNCPELAIWARADSAFSDHLIEFVKRKVSNRDTLCRLADTFYRAGAVSEALVLLVEAARLSNDGLATMQYVLYLLEQGRMASALEVTHAFLSSPRQELNPDFLLSPECDSVLGGYEAPPRTARPRADFEEIRVVIELEDFIAVCLMGDIRRVCHRRRPPWPSSRTVERVRFVPRIVALYAMCESAAFGVGDSRPYFRPVLALGDEFAAFFAMERILPPGAECSITARPIPQLSITQIVAADRNSGANVAFWDNAIAARHFEYIILVVGTWDCEYGIPDRVIDTQYQSVRQAVDDHVEMYVKMLTHLRAISHKGIFIVPAFARSQWAAPIVHLFNRSLRAALPHGPVMLRTPDR